MKPFIPISRYLGSALLICGLLTSCESSKEKPSANNSAVVGNQETILSSRKPPIRETFTTAEELAKFDDPLSRHNLAMCKVGDSTLATWTTMGASAYSWYDAVDISLRLNTPPTPNRISANAQIYLKNNTTGDIVRKYVAPFQFEVNPRPDSNFEAKLLDVFLSNPFTKKDGPPTSRNLDLGKFKLSMNITLDNGTEFVMPEFQIEVGRGNPFVDSRLELYKRNNKEK